MNASEIQNNINNFLSEVEKDFCNPLASQKNRFPSCDKLLNKFNSQREKWEVNGVDLTDDIVAMTNELCLANLILSEVKYNKLNYEPKPDLKNSKETIDFRISMNNGNIIYCDVKTIQPIVQDDWKKFIKHKEFFPKNNEVILDKDWLGGEIWHNWYNSRQAILNYSLEFEKKILTYNFTDRTRFVMICCSDGFDWGITHLEDFVYFYSTGSNNPDDKFSTMEKKFITDKNITFLKNINCFAYMERPKTKLKVSKFICPVRGPWIENRLVNSNQKTC